VGVGATGGKNGECAIQQAYTSDTAIMAV